MSSEKHFPVTIPELKEIIWYKLNGINTVAQHNNLEADTYVPELLTRKDLQVILNEKCDDYLIRKSPDLTHYPYHFE